MYPILPHSVVGRMGWTALNLCCPFSARRLLGLLIGGAVEESQKADNPVTLLSGMMRSIKLSTNDLI